MAVDRVIRGHDLFGMFSPEQTHRLSEFSSMKTLSAGEVVFDFNQPATHVYMLMNGDVQLRLPAEQQGISFVVSNIQRGELFGLSPLLDSPRYTSTALCVSDSEVLAIEGKRFDEMLRSNCPIGYTIMNRVAHIYFNRYIDVIRNLQGVVGQISLIR